ncbi:MAG: hypothetical protein A2381_11960 [Bdellovibrionales bacterium RIFOXYB1_FULL_37_110]|nr:MAG: hypothetical protein A2381_11960 [Bdellovibrionales bacterium RIFOXYB1_FULL_37_110]OFZ65201.1 MAG: hypothetical protein A2577_04395 [Bdellovibrionales bacterium RIFOXYD1_FULL_36_51]
MKNKNIFSKDIFHYNLGTLYAQKGELAIARYHLEKANSIGTHKNIVKNLDLVRFKLGLENESQMLDKVDQLSFSIMEIQKEDYLIGGLFFLMVFFIVLLKFTKFKKAFCFVCLFLSLFLFGAGQFIKKEFLTGIVLHESQLRTGPSSIYPVRTVIKNGQKLIVSKNVDGWLKVISPRPLEGWLSQNDIGLY